MATDYSSLKTEIADFIFRSSKDFDIDLNTKDANGTTTLHLASERGITEIVEFIIQSSKDFGIDLNAKDN